jgi:hypothetical protein
MEVSEESSGQTSELWTGKEDGMMCVGMTVVSYRWRNLLQIWEARAVKAAAVDVTVHPLNVGLFAVEQLRHVFITEQIAENKTK